MVIDSIQTVYTDALESAPGNVGQVRECSGQLMRFAKESGTAVVVVGHVTKGGGIAGPKTLEHIVDTVLYFEGEATLDYRLLRTTKNRFGSVDELGVFSMTEHGLVAVPNPSAVFLAARADGISGSAVTALMEGTRPVLVEVQALAAKSGYGTPAAGGHRARSQAPRGAAGGARAAGADLVRRSRRLRPGHGRRAAERAGRRSGRGRGAALQPVQPARAGATSSSSARSASAARSVPAARSSGASPRRRGSASAGCSAPPAAACRCPASSLVGLDHVGAAGAGACRVTSGWSSSPRGGAVALGGETPKQYRPIAGVPMVLRALRPFTAHPDVAQVVLVLPPDDAADPPGFPAPARRARRSSLVAGRRGAGGLGRAPASRRSSPNAPWCWCTTGPGPSSTRAVIDAVIALRPRGRGRGRRRCRVSDTLKEAAPRRRDAASLRTVPAARLWRAQTPQGFPRAAAGAGVRRGAARAAAGATDDAALVERSA